MRFPLIGPGGRGRRGAVPGGARALVAIALVLGGCTSWPRPWSISAPGGAPAAAGVDAGTASRVPAITGRVIFSGYSTQATMTDVAIAATVSLIDTVRNVTEATTLTDSAGVFQLNLTSGWVPAQGRTYYLEAVKGLNSNAAASDAARVRTIIDFQGGWRSITSASPGAPVILNPGTTALATIASLKGTNLVDPASLIGSLTLNPETYSPVANLSNTEYTQVRALVVSVLGDNTDPIADINFDPGPPPTYYSAAARRGGTLTTTQTTVNVGDTLTLRGLTFDTTLANNVVLFNGSVPGTVTGISADQKSLFVTVPAGAVSGPVTVKLFGSMYGIPFITVLGTLNAVVY